jgi:hypothetical protein
MLNISKKNLFPLIFLFGLGTISFPLIGQTYYAFAYYTEDQNLACGNAKIAVSKEVELKSPFAGEYQRQLQKDLYTQYPQNNISNRFAVLVYPRQSLIVYSFQTQPDRSWGNCISNGLGHIVANTMKEAEEIYRDRVAKSKATMIELFRWPIISNSLTND